MAHSFQTPDHLPHRRDGDPPDPAGLPRQRRGTSPQMHGRYPDFDVLEHKRHWDPVTRQLLEQRVQPPPPCRFFDEREQRTLGALLDVVLAQDGEPRVPVLAMVDAKLHAGRLDGYRYENLPPDDQTWKLVARRLDGFAERSAEEQHQLVSKFATGKLEWPEIDVSRAWSVIMRGALSEFYSHPWAFNEIGFRGPAYPRGYMRRNMGPTGVDPDEPREAFGLDPVRDLERRG